MESSKIIPEGLIKVEKHDKFTQTAYYSRKAKWVQTDFKKVGEKSIQTLCYGLKNIESQTEMNNSEAAVHLVERCKVG